MKDAFPMTDNDKAAALALVGCVFPVASYNKRFAGDMAGMARRAEPMITERQQKTLWKLVYMFRRQIKDKRLVELAQPVYEAERKASKRPSPDDLQALEDWNASAGK